VLLRDDVVADQQPEPSVFAARLARNPMDIVYGDEWGQPYRDQ
jgi:hypothetical protein